MILLIFLITINIFSSVIAQLMLKKGMMVFGAADFSLAGLWNLILAVFKNFYILGGLFLLGMTFTVWLFIISKINLNIVYPITTSLTIVLVATASYFLFRESVGLLHIAGIAVVIFGIFLILYRWWVKTKIKFYF